jgi:rSAM/selenodomain-associated transferase 1
MTTAVQLLVIAKQPLPRRVKTRLCPPCTPAEAASLARAALNDTLAAVAATTAARRIVVFEGNSSGLPEGFDVIPQRGSSLDERLAAAFHDAGAPSLLIGMDTPQITPQLLGRAIAALESPNNDAVLGLTVDGGFWAIGLKEAKENVFSGIPMSTSGTGVAQRARLVSLGYRCSVLPVLRDVDFFKDACDVAAQIRTSDFAYELGRVWSRMAGRIA